MKKHLCSFHSLLTNKRGASTVEYVIILVAGLLLGTLLVGVLSSDETKNTISTAIKNAINGEAGGGGFEPAESVNEPTNEPVNAPANQQTTQANESSNTPATPASSPQDPLSLFPDFVNDSLICLGGVANCLLKEDVKQDIRDAFQDPEGYIKEVIGYEDLKESFDNLTSIDVVQQWNDFRDDPLAFGQRKVDYLKDQWNEFSEDPAGNLWGLGKEVIGWNDVVAWWTGEDPNTGEELRVPNRNFRLLTALPLPTKALKLTKLADSDIVDRFVGLACANTNSGSCPNRTQRDNSHSPGSPEHREARWQEYLERKEREGENPQSREQWEATYENNINRARISNEKMNEYAGRLGWGEREKSVTVEIGGEEYTRRFDIADIEGSRAIEHKTSTRRDGSSTTFYNDEEIRWEIERDARLQSEEGWEIVWVFENAELSAPLKENLDRNGIQWVVIGDGETYDPKTGERKDKDGNVITDANENNDENNSEGGGSNDSNRNRPGR
ncbi:DUF4244 domain-containing protein [Desmospora activa]|uniref:Putative toxin of predicted polymorphic toxin system n=1 Tax=Desmospora activa DSM 45169 TaxID=1121389 RepID=A0A2T4Z200_9BACL|nr:DUF4244 domain-containing protein [Desmospora activa]PTM54782.1 putative toxin of predicted polymorphic toxin system [Desmospora activa DSM 45169]